MIHLLEIGFVLAAISAIAWTTVDITRKHIVTKISSASALVGLMLGQVLFLVPFIISTELGAVPDVDHALVENLFVGVPALSGSYWLYAGASIALNLLANWLFLRAVAISPLSLTTPYLALTPVFSAVVAFFTLGQTVGGWGILGILTVCVGAFFLNPGSKADGPLAPIKALWSERGSLYMVLVSLLWSVTPILDRKASVLTSPLWHTGFLALGIGVVIVAVLLARRNVGQMVTELKIMPIIILVAAFLLFAAMVLQLSAYDFVAIAYVETFKRAIGVVGAMAAGYLFFGEKDIMRRFVGAAVMVVGVALVLFSGG